MTAAAELLDVTRVRAAFPALDHGVAHFDGPGGSQVPRPVAEAVAAHLTAGVSNRGTVTEAERRAERPSGRRPARDRRPARRRRPAASSSAAR